MRKQLTSLALLSMLVMLGGCQSTAPNATPEQPTKVNEQPAKADTTKPKADAPPKSSAATATAALGKPAPDFALTALDGSTVKLSAFKGKTVVLEWFNPDCPFVRAAHSKGELKGMASKYKDKDVVWLAINSGAPGKQGHGKETNAKGKDTYGIDYPILFDEDGKVGKMYQAKRTPHMFVIDKAGVLAYQGAIDNTGSGHPDDVEKVENYVDAAINAISAGKPVQPSETKAYGCSVKYGS